MNRDKAVINLLREDLQAFAGYASARSSNVQGTIWLNANEAASANAADPEGENRRYPQPQPLPLQQALAELYQVDVEQVLIGRGSDEAIDLLVRALCTPQRDAVLVTPPVFGMYAVAARLQNARLLELPLQETAQGFSVDTQALIETAIGANAKLVFLCSPSNPTGSTIGLEQIAQVASALQGRALLVVDEAYAEFSDQPSAIQLLHRYSNLAILRTLSKAHALASARIGCLLADPELVAALRRCQAPYPIPGVCAELAVQALQSPVLQQTAQAVAQVIVERTRMQAALAQLPGVRRVYPSQGNFLLVRFIDAEAALQSLLRAGVVVRDQRSAPQLADALRISIGSREQNDQVLMALSRVQEAA